MVSADDVMDLRGVDAAGGQPHLVAAGGEGLGTAHQARPVHAHPSRCWVTRAGVEDAWLLAMRLFAPCHISGWSAAEHWDLTEQIFNAISVVTSAPQRTGNKHTGGCDFASGPSRRRRSSASRRSGRALTRLSVADPSRLVVDILTPRRSVAAAGTRSISSRTTGRESTKIRTSCRVRHALRPWAPCSSASGYRRAFRSVHRRLARCDVRQA